MILNQMKKLNQKITLARPVTQQGLNVLFGIVVNLTALGCFAAFAGALFLPDANAIVQRCHGVLLKLLALGIPHQQH